VAVERTAHGEMLHRRGQGRAHAGRHGPIGANLFVRGLRARIAKCQLPSSRLVCRYLIDRYRISRFKVCIRSDDFQGIYGKSLGSSNRTWPRCSIRFTPTDDEMLKAAYLFDRPPSSGTVCARVIAR